MATPPNPLDFLKRTINPALYAGQKAFNSTASAFNTLIAPKAGTGFESNPAKLQLQNAPARAAVQANYAASQLSNTNLRSDTAAKGLEMFRNRGPETPQTEFRPATVDPATLQLQQEAANLAKYGSAIAPTAPTELSSTPSPEAPTNYGESTAQEGDVLPATPRFADTYRNIYDQLGLGDIRSQLESTGTQLQELQDKKVDEISLVNENPWLTEGQRQDRVNAIGKRYEQKESNLMNRIQLFQSTFEQGRQEAQFIASQTAQEQRANTEFLEKRFEAEQKLREKGNEVLSVDDARALGVPYGTTVSEARKLGVTPQAEEKLGAGIVGEYQFYQQQEANAGRQPLSFDDYQTRDANRKAQANASSGLTPQQTTNFLRVTDKFQADEVMKQAQKGQSIISIANQVLADPGSATNQLKSLYVLVKNLDPDSAVREGELALAQQTQSYYNRFENSIAKLSKGRVISPAAASELAQATKDLAQAWFDAGSRRQQQYKAQSQVAGIGDAFDQYLGSFRFASTVGEADTVELRDVAEREGYDPSEVDTLLQQGMTIEDIRSLIEGEKKNDKISSSDAKRVASAIGQFESGGNYKALGPVLPSGSYKGDRAYGKYQVMGKNVPSWTKEALGKSMTPQQFLNDTKAQDAVAEYRMGKLLAQGYGVQDIASIWFSGRPLSKAGNAKDILGTSVPQYVRNVEALYKRTG